MPSVRKRYSELLGGHTLPLWWGQEEVMREGAVSHECHARSGALRARDVGTAAAWVQGPCRWDLRTRAAIQPLVALAGGEMGAAARPREVGVEDRSGERAPLPPYVPQEPFRVLIDSPECATDAFAACLRLARGRRVHRHGLLSADAQSVTWTSHRWSLATVSFQARAQASGPPRGGPTATPISQHGGFNEMELLEWVSQASWRFALAPRFRIRHLFRSRAHSAPSL
jgi:hypothetical protein